jgi:hypothetical protein
VICTSAPCSTRGPSRAGSSCTSAFRYGNEPEDGEAEEPLFHVEWPAAIGGLDQDVKAGLTEREAPELVLAERLHGLEVDFAAVGDLHSDAVRGEIGAQGRDAGFHLGGRRRVVGAHVRRGRDRRDAVRSRPLRELAAVLDGARPVVQPREDVGVQVDHACRRRIGAS